MVSILVGNITVTPATLSHSRFRERQLLPTILQATELPTPVEEINQEQKKHFSPGNKHIKKTKTVTQG